MRTLVILHGMSAALAIAALLHLIILLPRRPRAPRGAALGFVLSLAALYVLGWIAYPAFRTEIRFDLIRDPARMWLANLFDVKEFLSVGALFAGLAIGAACLLPSPGRPRRDTKKVRALVAGLYFVLGVLLFNTVVGIVLASYKTL